MRAYEVAVCSICQSDDIMSNEDESYCNECKQWMNCWIIKTAEVADER